MRTSSSCTILMTIWPGVTDFTTSWPTAFSFTFSVKSRTTSSATSASSNARRTSRMASLTSLSVSAPRLVSLSKMPERRSERLWNIATRFVGEALLRVRDLHGLVIDHHVVLVCLPLRQPLVPGFHIAKPRTGHVECEIAVHEGAAPDIRDRQLVPENIGTPGELCIENAQTLACALCRRFNGCDVPFGCRGANQAEEDGHN